MADRKTITAGVLSGILAGIVMGVLAMFVSRMEGQGLLAPLYQIGALFWGVNALVGGLSVAFVGLITHLVISGILGGIFAALTEGQHGPGPAFVGGIAYGITVWAVMTFLVQPWANPTMSDRTALTQGWWFLEHLAFGGMLFTTPLIARAMTKRSEGTHHEQTRDYRHAA